MTEVAEKKRSVADLRDDQLVELYIKLRDRRAQRKAAYETEDLDDKTKMEKVEGILLDRFRESGHESVKTAAGTAYKSTTVSVSVADWPAFFEFVQANDAWEMLVRGANKAVVKEFKEANDDLPPGLNWSEKLSIGVRRS